MAIELIAKVAPKNDGFIGMVDADQVIGTSGGAYASYLPSSAISTNSITEPYLKISNAPIDGYYLQWDETNRLTWAEVVGGSDVAWSGAYAYYAVSSLNKTQYQQYTGFSGNLHYFYNSGVKLTKTINSSARVYDRFDHNLYVASSVAISKFYDSESDLTTLLNDNYPGSSNVNIKTSGSLHKLWTWSSNKSWYANSSNVRFRFRASSSRWNYVSSQLYSGGTYYTKLNAPTDDRQLANKKYVDDSIAGAGGYTDEMAQDAVGGMLTSEFKYVDSTPSISLLGYSTISSNAKDGKASGSILGSWYTLSSSKLSRAYASTSTGKFEPALTKGNLTATGPISLDQTRQVIGGAAVISISNYIGSTQAISRFRPSTGVWNYVSSQHTSGGTLYANSISLNANTISGLILPIWPSAAASKRYIDIISGNIKYKYVGSSSALTKYLASSAFKRNNWNSHAWLNSGIIWDESLSAWKPKKSGATGGVTNLSDLVINADKDWNSKSIYNLISISSTKISSGTILTSNFTAIGDTISGLRQPYFNSGAANKRYVDIISSNAIVKFAPSRSRAYGLQQIYGGSGSISHTLTSKPNFWSVTPSGNVNFGIKTRVDSSYIHVNLTTVNNKYVYWYAST